MRGQRPRTPFSKVFIFEEKSLWTSHVYENYFYLKQGSDYVTATEFVSAPIFKSIDPSISRNYAFFLCELYMKTSETDDVLLRAQNVEK